MKNILLSVSGLSPQVLTEALYALFEQGRHVDEIHVITTRTGKDLIHAGLLASGEGAFFQFLREYGIKQDAVSFPPGNIHVLKDENGYELDDIVTPEDNEILMKKCMELAWRFTATRDQAVFFMIAGGRKTMSASLALSAQFYGRPCDRIYHVLVSPEFESCRDFYFPPRKNRLIKTIDSNGKVLFRDTRDARVWLVSMPFVSVRERLTPADLQAPADPDRLLMSLIRDNPPGLVLYPDESKISFRGRELDLKPAQMALLTFFAMKRIKCGCSRSLDKCARCSVSREEIEDIPENQQQIRQIFEQIARSVQFPGMTSGTGILSLDYSNFASYRSKLNTALKSKLGPEAEDIIISSIGPRTAKRYGIKLRANFLKIKS